MTVEDAIQMISTDAYALRVAIMHNVMDAEQRVLALAVLEQLEELALAPYQEIQGAIKMARHQMIREEHQG